MNQVETEHGVFITAEGLSMYLKPDDALGLIRDCAALDVAFPPGGIWKWAAWPPLDRVGFMRRIRPSITLLEFG
jgi:hypothetical protein